MSEVARTKVAVDPDSKDWRKQQRIKLAKELKRQEQELADLRKNRLLEQQRLAQRAKEREAAAAKLQPGHPTQQVVEGRMTERTTRGLMAMLRHVSLNPKAMVAWLAVDPGLAREVMQRAYPMGLQMGLMCHCRDQDTTLRFSNGSIINFAWPGKAEVVA